MVAAPVPGRGPNRPGDTVRATDRAWYRLKPHLVGLSDLLLGSCCAGCDTPGPAWCGSCHTVLCAGVAPVELLRAGAAGRLPVAAGSVYDGVVRAGLVAHKDRGRWGLARPLAQALAAAVRVLLAATPTASAGVVLVPVPSTARAVRTRGYDHALSLARHAAAELRREGVAAAAAPVLRLSTGHGQVGLGGTARRANRAGAMRLRRGCAGTPWTVPVVVVDDIATTGASLLEAARVLHGAGAEVAGGAVVARVPPTGRS